MVLATYLVFRAGKAIGQGALVTQGLRYGPFEFTRYFGPPIWVYSEEPLPKPEKP